MYCKFTNFSGKVITIVIAMILLFVTIASPVVAQDAPSFDCEAVKASKLGEAMALAYVYRHQNDAKDVGNVYGGTITASGWIAAPTSCYTGKEFTNLVYDATLDYYRGAGPVPTPERNQEPENPWGSFTENPFDCDAVLASYLGESLILAQAFWLYIGAQDAKVFDTVSAVKWLGLPATSCYDEEYRTNLGQFFTEFMPEIVDALELWADGYGPRSQQAFTTHR